MIGTSNFFKKLLYKYTRMYATYKKVDDIFVEPELYFDCNKWNKSGGLPVWRHGPIISIARDSSQYNTEHGRYGNWAKYTSWKDEFLQTKKWWGRTWRRFIKPHYQLPLWMSFYVFNYCECVKSKWDYFSYEFPPQFTVVLFGWSWTWTLHAPRSTKDYMGRDGRSYPDDDAYWESIYDYLFMNEDNRMYNAVSTIHSTIYRTPNEEKNYQTLSSKKDLIEDKTSQEYDKLLKDMMKLGTKVVWTACRPEYIKSSHIDEYFKEVDKLKNSSKEYKKYLWI